MRKAILRSFAVFMCIAILLSGAPPASGSSDVPQQLDELVSDFMTAYGLNENNFSFAYYNTVTGETHMFNENRLMSAASVYKLPLSMYYYEQTALGNINPSSRYAGYSLSDAHRMILQHSNNEAAEAMRRAVGTYSNYKIALDKYTGVSAVEIGGRYLSSNYFNSLTILNTLKYLHSNAEFFSEAIGYLKAANPSQFFKRYVSDYEIAQKYGWLTSVVNTAGIVYTPTPYLLCVFTQNLGNAETVIGRFNELLCNYTVTRHPRWDPSTMIVVNPSSANVVVDGINTEINAYSVGGNNYFRLRDLAYVLNGTEKQFSIVQNESTRSINLTSGRPYSIRGNEMAPGDGLVKFAVLTSNKLYLDGTELSCNVYNIGGSNYVRIRDLMRAVNVRVDYSSATKTITLDTSRDY